MSSHFFLRPSARLALLLVVASGCSRKEAGDATRVEAAPANILTVTALEVRSEPVVRQVELVGTLEGNQEVTLASQVAGRVTGIRADLGDHVAKDQVLIEIDTTEYQLAIDRQQAALAQVLVKLGMTREDEPPPDPSSTSTVRRATADLGEAKTNFERSKALVAKGVAAQQVYDTAETRYRVAEANLATAVEDIRNQIAQIRNLRAQLDLARRNLSETRIRAPFAGVVRIRSVEVGQFVKDQTQLISLASANPLKLRAEAPERWYPYVSPGAGVQVSVEAYPGEKFPGTVTRVARSVDPQSRSFAIEARIDNGKDRLRPGLFARARLTTSRSDSVLRVPAAAVVSFYGVLKIYAIESNEIHERVVRVGDRFGDLIEVTDGLTSGTLIATSEISRLRQGTRVQAQKGR